MSAPQSSHIQAFLSNRPTRDPVRFYLSISLSLSLSFSLLLRVTVVPVSAAVDRTTLADLVRRPRTPPLLSSRNHAHQVRYSPKFDQSILSTTPRTQVPNDTVHKLVATYNALTRMLASHSTK